MWQGRNPLGLFARPRMAGGAAGEGLMVRGLPEHFLAGWEGLGRQEDRASNKARSVSLIPPSIPPSVTPAGGGGGARLTRCTPVPPEPAGPPGRGAGLGAMAAASPAGCGALPSRRRSGTALYGHGRLLLRPPYPCPHPARSPRGAGAGHAPCRQRHSKPGSEKSGWRS